MTNTPNQESMQHLFTRWLIEQAALVGPRAKIIAYNYEPALSGVAAVGFIVETDRTDTYGPTVSGDDLAKLIAEAREKAATTSTRAQRLRDEAAKLIAKADAMDAEVAA